MLQGIERKQETSQIKTTVTAMLHDSTVEFPGQESFRGRISAVPRSFLRVVSVAGCLTDRPLLSQNLTEAWIYHSILSFLRKPSLPRPLTARVHSSCARPRLRTPQYKTPDNFAEQPKARSAALVNGGQHRAISPQVIAMTQNQMTLQHRCKSA
jgi:hypothetical protein